MPPVTVLAQTRNRYLTSMFGETLGSSYVLLVAMERLPGQRVPRGIQGYSSGDLLDLEQLYLSWFGYSLERLSKSFVKADSLS